MLRCREAARLSSKSLDTSLTVGERVSLGVHLAMCKACSQYRRQIRTLREILRREAERIEDLAAISEFRLTDGERDELLRALAVEGNAGPA